MIRFRVFSFIISNLSEIFLLCIRSISIGILFHEIQTLISISRYAMELHHRRTSLIEQLQILGCLFHSTVRQCENQLKTRRKFKRMYDEKRSIDRRIRTI